MTGTFPAQGLDPYYTALRDFLNIASITGVYDAVRDFGFVGDGSTNNDSAFTSMLNALDGEDTTCTVLFRPGIYVFATAKNLAPSGIHFLRLRGMGGMPFFNQTPDGDMMTVFKYTNASATTFLDIDPGSGTLQSGVYLENINLWNTGHASNMGVSYDRTNNWRQIECGYQGWGTGVYSEANDDNAHGKMKDCMMNIPAGKIGIDVPGGDTNDNPGGGFCVDGGSYSGDTGAIGIRGGPWGSAMTLCGDAKFDGCTGGGIIWEGSLLRVGDSTFERCGDATHYAIDILHNADRANSGRGNIVTGATIVGDGSSLSGRFGSGTFSCHVGSGVYLESVASGWLDSGTYNIKAPQLWDMPSSASYPIQLVDGSTLPNVIDALQQSQVVRS